MKIFLIGKTGNAGIIDEQVYPPKRIPGLLKNPATVFILGNTSLYRHRFDAKVLALRNSPLRAFMAALIIHYDPTALGSKRRGACCPNACPATGNDCNRTVDLGRSKIHTVILIIPVIVTAVMACLGCVLII